jgi:hypothetical protein
MLRTFESRAIMSAILMFIVFNVIFVFAGATFEILLIMWGVIFGVILLAVFIGEIGKWINKGE